MALTKEIKNDKIEVVSLDAGYSVIQVRTATIIKEDGEEISRKFHRTTYVPTDDMSDVSADVAVIASSVFTEENKTKYEEFINSSKLV